MISRGFFAYVLLSFVRISMGTQCGIGQTYSEEHKVTSATVQCSGICDCNIAASGVSGRITDGPGKYSPMSRCRWHIRSNVKPAEIIINQKPGSVFETESFDRVFVAENYRNVATYDSNDAPSNFVTHTGNVLVEFWSDDTVEKEGFELEWFLQTTNGCIACAAGKYKVTTGSGPCTPCPENSFSISGSDSQTDCTCNAGSSGPDDGGVCTLCERGKYQTRTGALECDSCPENSDNNNAGSTVCRCNTGSSGPDGGPFCTLCEKGKYQDHIQKQDCKNCESGKYLDVTGQDACKGCPENSGNNHVASNQKSDCKCNTGTTGADGGVCTQCNAGKYKDAIGDGNCRSCQPNSNSAKGSTRWCECNAGWEKASDSEDCVHCQAGKYKENTGPASDWEKCVNCQAGKYKGNTGPGTCTNCAHGKYGDINVTGATTCTNCAHGKYGDINVTGATTSDVCNVCPVNTYTTHKGSTSCTLCSTAYDAGMLTDAFNNDRDHFGCIAFVLT